MLKKLVFGKFVKTLTNSLKDLNKLISQPILDIILLEMARIEIKMVIIKLLDEWMM